MYAVLTLTPCGARLWPGAAAHGGGPYCFGLVLPEAIAGLTLGCFLSNLLGSPTCWTGSSTLATFLAALWTARAPQALDGAYPARGVNMVIVGAEIAWFEVASAQDSPPPGSGTASPWASERRWPAASWGTLLLQGPAQTPLFRALR